MHLTFPLSGHWSVHLPCTGVWYGGLETHWSYLRYRCTSKTLRPCQIGRHFADNAFKCIFFNKNVLFCFKFHWQFPMSFNNNLVLVQILAWHLTGSKLLSTSHNITWMWSTLAVMVLTMMFVSMCQVRHVMMGLYWIAGGFHLSPVEAFSRKMVGGHSRKQTQKNRTTRMPAFWGYPLLPHDYPYYWFILDPKSKQDKVNVTNLKNLPKVQIFKYQKEKHYMQHISDAAS